MGCGGSVSPEFREQHAESRRIDAELAQERKRVMREIKLLLLGAASAGKSTFAKQLKVLYMNGFSDAERATFQPHVDACVLRNLRVLGSRAKVLQDNDLYKHCPKLLDALRSAQVIVLRLNDYRDELKAFWAHEGVQTVLKEPGVPIDHCISYFMADSDRISAEGYVPTTEDIMQVKIKTLGLVETVFDHRDVVMRLVDVGGQKNERRKWIHAFQEVTAVIFVVALTDFELLLEEDGATNRMTDSLQLFDNVINNKWLAATAIMLCLNKTDLFEQRIRSNPAAFAALFPHYTGPPGDPEASMVYVRQAFLSQEKSPEGVRHIYYYRSCNTDTKTVEKVFAAVSDVLLSSSLDTFI